LLLDSFLPDSSHSDSEQVTSDEIVLATVLLVEDGIVVLTGGHDIGSLGDVIVII
jgi:hypothetical protein